MVADGSFVDASTKPKESWFRPQIRILSIVTQSGSSPFSSDTSEWTLCIVGSSLLDSTDRNRSFLQVASWNGLTFRYYQVEPSSLSLVVEGIHTDQNLERLDPEFSGEGHFRTSLELLR
jgi:hypothetical protein